MLEQFDQFADQAIKTANQIARQYEQEYVGTEHVLLAIAQTPGPGADLLRKQGLTYDRIKTQVDSLIHQSMEETWVFGRLPGTPHFKNVVACAIQEARALNAKHIGTEHLLLGLLRENGCVAQVALANLGLNLQDLRSDIARMSEIHQPDASAHSRRPPRTPPNDPTKKKT
jgi:ATP-dependent Clp protease ATP-binding subunit ClpC